jgi:hypothetical protein
VPPNAASLLYFLGKKPFTKVSDMTDAVGFKSPAEVSKALEWLVNNVFVKRESYRVSKRGRPSVFAVLSLKAYSYLNIDSIPGKGDFEHKLYQHLIFKKLHSDGFSAKIEGKIGQNQKSVDVLVRTKDGKFMAFEVTLHFENLLSNIHDDFNAGAAEVVIVIRDKSDLNKAMKIISQDQTLAQKRNRISFQHVSYFFD